MTFTQYMTFMQVRLLNERSGSLSHVVLLDFIHLFPFPYSYFHLSIYFLIHSCILWYINTPFVVYIQEEKILKEQSATDGVVPKTEQTS